MELGLYIHLPFCIRKCHYCDFLSFPCTSGRGEVTTYMEALHSEARYWGRVYSGLKVPTVFIGGGTPSVLSPEEITALMGELRSQFNIDPEAEITIESNPKTLTKEKLEAYHLAGINRLSMGLQSTNNQELALLGRIHTYEDFLENYQMARAAGFSNINIDLMSALPGQTTASYEQTLKQVLALEPEHISAYSLIIEEGTNFAKWYDKDSKTKDSNARNYPPLPDETQDREMYHLTKALLKTYGYQRYEISNYAKPGFASKHNLSYWTGKNYLGLGLGASSYVAGVRFKNPSEMKAYLAQMPYEEVEPLDTIARMEEFMFLGLRLSEGVSEECFAKNFGQALTKVYGAAIEKYEKQGLLCWSGLENTRRLRLTDPGMDVSNYVMSDFLLS